MKQSKIPIIIIAGHLGSGKTSLINNLLTYPSGLKIGVIVNDFGELNVDAMLIDRRADEIVSLSNGCLCCSLSNELDDSINKIVDEDSDLDLILVEASGIADPSQMISLVSASQNECVYLRDSIYVIDGANFSEFYKHNSFIASNGISVAKIIILNKIDLMNPEEIVQIENIIRELNSKVFIIKTDHAIFDPRLVIDAEKNKFEQLKLGQTESNHSHKASDKHEHYHQVTFRESKPLDPIQTTNFLNNFPSSVYRVKGWINFGQKADGQKLLLQIVNRSHELKLVKWYKNENQETVLVFIGLEINEKELLNELSSLIDKNPDEINENNIIRAEFIG